MNRIVGTIKAKKATPFPVSPEKMSTVYRSGRFMEIVTAMSDTLHISDYKRLSKTQYAVLSTGEICTYSPPLSHEKRTNLRKSFRNLRRIINANFTGSSSEKHIVLTYAEDMHDYQKAVTDFKKFWDKFRYHYPSTAHVRIIEPRQSGTWHIHMLVKSTTGEALEISVSHVHSLWGHGLVFANKLPATDNYGAYFSAVYTNLDDAEMAKETLSKSQIKGSRLKYYPPNIKFYTCSKGIIRPFPERMPYGIAQEIVAGTKKVFENASSIVRVDANGEEREINRIQYQQYRITNENGDV